MNTEYESRTFVLKIHVLRGWIRIRRSISDRIRNPADKDPWWLVLYIIYTKMYKQYENNDISDLIYSCYLVVKSGLQGGLHHHFLTLHRRHRR